MSKHDSFFDLVGKSNNRRPRFPGGSNFAPPTASFDYAPQSRNDKLSCWAQSDNTFYGVARAHDEIPSGMYRCELSERFGPVLLRQHIELDGIINLPDSASDEVLDEIRKFRGMKDRFKAHGFLHKRGILLWGRAGSGKTVIVHQICRLIVSGENGIAIMVDIPRAAAECLQLIRRIEPHRPIVAIFEDIDSLIDRYGENEYLSLLDGEAQVDNIVFIATTNYPERLDVRFVDRPSRFDTVRYIGMPDAEARSIYLQAKAAALVNGQLEAYVTASEGLSIAHLKELVILTQCFGYPPHEASERLAKMRIKPQADRSPDYRGAGL